MVGNAIICIARDESCAIIHSHFPTCLQLLLIMMSTATQAGAVSTQPWDCSCVAEVCKPACHVTCCKPANQVCKCCATSCSAAFANLVCLFSSLQMLRYFLCRPRFLSYNCFSTTISAFPCQQVLSVKLCATLHVPGGP